jgi:transcriptional regulator with XRE-family HTH domain
MTERAVPGANGGDPPRPLLRAMLGDVLRRTRLAQGRTLADVARQARVSLAYLSELERGRKEGSSEVLAAVCDALGIELSALVLEAGAELGRESARRARVIRLAEIRTRIAGAPAGHGGAGHAPTASAMLSLAA